MKNYKITINGNVYNATVEEAGGFAAPVAAPVAVAAPPALVATPAPVAAPPAPVAAPVAQAPVVTSTPGAGTKVDAPMPGTVLRYSVNVGDTVAVNQVVAILEAMKMENEIVTPVAGKVSSIVAAAGSSVSSGDVLLTVE